MRKLLASLLFGIFLISLASAADWDNLKKFDEEIGDYGKVRVTNWLGLGRELGEAKLISNTDICEIDCSAIKEITLYEDGPLIEDVRFLTLKKKGKFVKQKIRQYSFSYLNENNEWIRFSEGDEFKAGTYKVRLDGKKKPTRTVDWQIKVQGKWIDEWALWSPGLFIYDEINDSVINTGLWVNASSFAGDTTGSVNPSENTDYMEMTQFNNGLGGGVVHTIMNMTAYSLPEIGNIDNITIRVMFQVNSSDGDSNSGATDYLFVFGIEAFKITNPKNNGLQTATDDSVWWIIRNESKEGDYFGIYNDGAFVKEINAVNNNITIMGDAYSNNAAGYSLQRIYYVYGFQTEGAVALNSPADGYISPTAEIDFNCSAVVTGGATLTNISLLGNFTGTWSINQTLDIPTTGRSLVSYYPLDELSGPVIDIRDVSNGTNVGATRGVTGKIDNAFSFDGSTDYVLADENGTNFGKNICNNGCTFCSWFNSDDNSTFRSVVSRFNDSGEEDRFFSLITANTGSVWFIVLENGTSGFFSRAISTQTFRENEWYHACGVYNGSSSSPGNSLIYLNGAFDTFDPTNITIDSTLWQDNESVFIGRRGDGFYFNGEIDEVGIWNRSLTPEEISELYNSGSGERPISNSSFTRVFNQNITGQTLWSCKACDSDGDCGYATENRTVDLDLDSPNITIITPTGTLDYGVVGEQQDLNWTVNEKNLDSCWYAYPLDNSCYQESANVSNQTGIDGSCSLDYSGSYEFQPNYFYVNYTKPSNATSAKWLVSHGNDSQNEPYNVTIPSSCFYYRDNKVQLRFYSEISSFISYGQCYNGSWNNITDIKSQDDISGLSLVSLFNKELQLNDGNFSSHASYFSAKWSQINSKNDTTSEQFNVSSAIFEEGIYWDITPVIEVNCEDNHTTFTLEEGKYNLTFFANDTVGHTSSETTSWSYLITQTNETFSQNTFETSTETFELNLVTTSDILTVESFLNYNGTVYPAVSDCSVNECNLSVSIDIDLVESGESEKKSLFWMVNGFSGNESFSINTTPVEQNVTRVHLEECGPSFTNDTLNFTAFNEADSSVVDPFLFEGTFDIWLGNGNIKRQANFSNSSVSSLSLCISPTDRNFRTDATIEYDEAGGTSNYTRRNYYFGNDTINSTVQNIILGLLLAEESTSFILRVQDTDILPVPNVLIYIQRFYPGTNSFETVQIAETDESGQTIGFFKTETVDYRFILKINGTTVLTTEKQKIIGTSVPFTITFTIGEDAGSAWEVFEEIEDLEFINGYNKTSQIYNFTYTDTSGNFDFSLLEIYRVNATGNDPLICNETISQSSAILSCNLTGNLTSQYIAKGIIFRSGERNLVFQEQFNIETFSGTVGDLGLFLGWFIILVSAFAFKFNEIAGIFMVNIAMIFVNAIGLISFGPVFIGSMIAISILIGVILER